ncbi:hypothetical protein IW262DRAFT_563622 [Armillaria fumosa]|nr:hypothetical protein IW262DRAFT_563622 [Armillaria fumosa]
MARRLLFYLILIFVPIITASWLRTTTTYVFVRQYTFVRAIPPHVHHACRRLFPTRSLYPSQYLRKSSENPQIRGKARSILAVQIKNEGTDDRSQAYDHQRELSCREIQTAKNSRGLSKG